MKNEVDINVQKTAASFTGIIVPIEWDEDGTPIAIALATEDEQEYRIVEADSKARALRKLLRKRVRIKGTIKASEDVRARADIIICSFKVLEDRL